ncbi:hypothetical protein TNCV_5141451 [Trichonephila clavipes]|nr:hypothetical protein TNCV_5141451 [Trichonephila clavipes]
MQSISKTLSHLFKHINQDIVSFGSDAVPYVFQGLEAIFVNQGRYKLTGNPTTNFGILTLTLLFSFLLWVVLMSVRWKNFRMQRRVQQGRNRRKELTEEETEDTESLLSSAYEEASLTSRIETDT